MIVPSSNPGRRGRPGSVNCRSSGESVSSRNWRSSSRCRSLSSGLGATAQNSRHTAMDMALSLSSEQEDQMTVIRTGANPELRSRSRSAMLFDDERSALLVETIQPREYRPGGTESGTRTFSEPLHQVLNVFHV